MSLDRKRVVIVGSSFAGLAAAHALKRHLGRDHDVVVISRNDEFIFTPSLVWVPFGIRDKRAISRLVRPELGAAGVVFKHAPVTRLDLAAHRVITAQGSEPFDYLVLATGSVPDFDAVVGLGPRGGYTHSIASWSDATLARMALEKFVEAPGPVVIGGAPGAACMDVAYEFLFAMVLWLRKRGLTAKVPVTFLNPAGTVGDVGHPGGGDADALARLLTTWNVSVISGAEVKRVEPTTVELEDGQRIPFSYSMLLPRRLGGPVVARSEIADDEGRIAVDRWGRATGAPAVFAAGAAAAYRTTGVGPPSAGYLAEASAEVVASNVAASILGTPELELPTLSHFAGSPPDPDAFALEGKVLRENVWLFPGPEARWATAAFAARFARPAMVRFLSEELGRKRGGG